MSLINEALKKAQRLRAEDQASSAGAVTPGASANIPKRSQARSANTMVLIGAGALVLVVVSVVATVYLLNRPSTPSGAAPTPAISAPTAETSSGTPLASPAVVVPPVVVAPEIKSAPALPISPILAAESTAIVPAPNSIPADSLPPVAVAATPPTAATQPATRTPPRTNPAASSTAPETANPIVNAPATPDVAPPPPASGKPDERVAAFVDSIRVTATRAAEGRVLMNDRFYRENDIVERTLGVRLVKVAVDRLTFSDANGVTYVKYF